jgi:hypothetical protein
MRNIEPEGSRGKPELFFRLQSLPEVSRSGFWKLPPEIVFWREKWGVVAVTAGDGCPHSGLWRIKSTKLNYFRLKEKIRGPIYRKY